MSRIFLPILLMLTVAGILLASMASTEPKLDEESGTIRVPEGTLESWYGNDNVKLLFQCVPQGGVMTPRVYELEIDGKLLMVLRAPCWSI